MNQQIYLFATVFLSVAVVFLFYQNVKMERRFNRELQGITSNMREMTQMIALNNDISSSRENSPVNNNEHPKMVINEKNEQNPNIILAEPEVTPGLVTEMSSLMRDYSEFNEPQLVPDIVPEYSIQEELLETELTEEKYDSISEDLKREIEELEKRDSSSECLDEITELVNTDVQELNEIDNTEGLEVQELNEIDNTEGSEILELDGEIEELRTFDESALEQLNPSEEYKNMVDDIIATASEAENTNEIEESKGSWDGSVDITDEGVFVELDNTRKSIDQLSVKELTYLCKMSGLKSKGKKADLVSRFIDYSTQKKNTFFLESN